MAGRTLHINHRPRVRSGWGKQIGLQQTRSVFPGFHQNRIPAFRINRPAEKGFSFMIEQTSWRRLALSLSLPPSSCRRRLAALATAVYAAVILPRHLLAPTGVVVLLPALQHFLRPRNLRYIRRQVMIYFVLDGLIQFGRCGICGRWGIFSFFAKIRFFFFADWMVSLVCIFKIHNFITF